MVASKTVEVSQLVNIAQSGMEVTVITHHAGQLTGISGFIFTASSRVDIKMTWEGQLAGEHVLGHSGRSPDVWGWEWGWPEPGKTLVLK